MVKEVKRDLSDFEREDASDEVLDAVYELLKKRNSGMQFVDSNRVEMVNAVYDAMCMAVAGDGVSVTRRMHTPFISDGCVSITGKNIKIVNTKLFVTAAKLAANIEIDSKTDGTAVIDLAFHGLTRKVSD